MGGHFGYSSWETSLGGMAGTLYEIWDGSLQRSDLRHAEEWVFQVEGTASAKTQRQE